MSAEIEDKPGFKTDKDLQVNVGWLVGGDSSQARMSAEPQPQNK